MDTEDFSKIWRNLCQERGVLLERRTDLETELAEVRNTLSRVDQALHQLAPLAGVHYVDQKDIPNLGLTDAIRCIFKRTSERYSADEVRRRLTEEHYDLSRLSAPMASIYKILSRLEESEEVIREKEEGRVYYRWNGMTDDEIPF
jgi:predicted nuclease with TOPRIM domain